MADGDRSDSGGGAGGGGGGGGLARNLGRFFGNIKRGFSEPVAPGGERERKEVRREQTEEERDTPRGRVTVRRTVIEEVDLPPDDGGGPGGAGRPNG